MGAFIQNAKLIIDDFKSSWYFRIWSFFWLFCAVTVFACLIILGKRTTEDSHRDLNIYIDNATSLTFPRFAIRMIEWKTDTGQTIVSKACTHNGVPLHTQQCVFGEQTISMDKCFVVPGDTITINNVWGDLFSPDSHIRCSVNTTGVDPTGNTFIVWSAEAPSFFGDVESHDLYVAPTAHALIVLDSEVVDTHEHGEFTMWNKRLEYTTTVSNPGQYNITTVIGSFGVPHFYEQNPYTGWMGVADVGGFAFFTIILHTIMMMAVGLCLDNNSRFLKGEDSGHRPI